MTNKTIDQRIQDIFDRQGSEINAALVEICGQLPDHIPEQYIFSARSHIESLINSGHNTKYLAKCVKWEMNDKLSGDKIPGIVQDAADFVQKIHDLAILKYAAVLQPDKCLEILGGKYAKNGYKSSCSYQQSEHYQHKQEFQKEAEPFFINNNYNISKTIEEPKLADWVKWYPRKRTLRNWLREIRPDGKKIKGRPSKKGVAPP